MLRAWKSHQQNWSAANWSLSIVCRESLCGFQSQHAEIVSLLQLLSSSCQRRSTPFESRFSRIKEDFRFPCKFQKECRFSRLRCSMQCVTVIEFMRNHKWNILYDDWLFNIICQFGSSPDIFIRSDRPNISPNLRGFKSTSADHRKSGTIRLL
jgi:hypothetical protein